MRSRSSRLVPLAAALAAFSLQGRALADPPSADVQRADALFKAAQQLLQGHQIHEACADFAESQSLDPAPGTALNLADCYEQEGKLATAQREFLQAADFAARRNQGDRERFARAEAARLEKRVHKITLALPSGLSGVSVALDGEPLNAASWAAPHALDPGSHEIVVSAAGKRPRTIAVAAAADGITEKIVVLPWDVSVPAKPAPPPPPATPDPEPPEPVAEHSGSGNGMRTTGFVVGGAGIVGIALGAAFGLRAIGLKNDSDPHCTGTLCDAQGLSDRNDAQSSATISTIGFTVGLAATAAGVVLVLVSPRKTTPERTVSLALSPAVGPGAGGLSLGGRW
jgi:hypothetical protein